MNLFNNWQLFMGIFVIVGAMGMFFALWQLIKWAAQIVRMAVIRGNFIVNQFWSAALIFGISTLILVIGIRGL